MSIGSRAGSPFASRPAILARVSDPILIDPRSYRTVPWTNGGGTATDIVTGEWFRLARTRIERPGPFSLFPLWDRLLAVTEGEGLLLHSEGHAAIDCRRPFRAAPFPGEWPIVSELTEGPVGVLNLFGRRDRTAIALDFVSEGRVADPPVNAILILHATTGPVRLRVGPTTHRLDHDAALHLPPGSARGMEVQEGRLAVAQLLPRATSAAVPR